MTSRRRRGSGWPRRFGITNLIGNGVATVVIAKIEKKFDAVKHEVALHGPPESLAEVATEG